MINEISKSNKPVSSAINKLTSSSWFATAAVLSSVLALIALLISRASVIPSGSVDLAHHYVLIKEFLDFGGRTVPRLYFGTEMYIYPALSHWAAAKLTLLTGSVLLSISLVLVTCAVLIYGSLFLMAARRGVWTSIVAFLILFILLLPVEKWHLALGYEIIGNFFFAQLFGEALFMVIALVIYRFTKPISVFRSAAVFAATWAICYAHLLPGLRLLAVFGVVLIFDISLFVLHAKREEWHKDAIRGMYQCLAYGIFGLLLIWQHPAYKAMKQLSSNDGWLTFDISTPVVVVMISLFNVIVLPLLIKNTLVRHDQETAFDRLSLSMGIAALLLMLVQLAAFLVFKSGSPYAIKKHLFFIVSIDALLCVVLISQYLERGIAAFAKQFINNSRVPRPELIISFAFLAAALTVNNIYPMQSQFSIDNLIRLESAVASIPADRVVLPMDMSLPGPMNYFVAIGDCRLPRNKTTYDLLVGRTDEIVRDIMAGKVSLDYVVTDSPVKFRDILFSMPQVQFVTYSKSPYVTVTRNNVYSSITFGETIHIGGNPSAANFLVNGWSWTEPWGVWSNAETATLIFRVHDNVKRNSYVLRAKVNPWIAKGRAKQPVSIFVNEKMVIKKELTSPEELSIPVRPNADGVVQIDFRIKDLVSPKQLMMSDDDRKLGIGLISIELN